MDPETWTDVLILLLLFLTFFLSITKNYYWTVFLLLTALVLYISTTLHWFIAQPSWVHWITLGPLLTPLGLFFILISPFQMVIQKVAVREPISPLEVVYRCPRHMDTEEVETGEIHVE